MSEHEQPTVNSLMTGVEIAVKRLTAPTRRLVRVLIGFAIALALAFGVIAYVAVNEANVANEAQHAAKVVQNASITACQQGNTQRAEEQKVWDQFLNLLVDSPGAKQEQQALQNFADSNVPASADPTTWKAFMAILLKYNADAGPQAQQEVKQFEAYIAKVEAPHNCAKEYGK